VNSGWYIFFVVAGLVVSIVVWSRLTRRSDRLAYVHLAAVIGAFIGAKLVYIAAEGWLHWDDPKRWVILATGKSITGALLGGYAAVEIGKKIVGHKEPTGDWFALMVPISIMLGRVGCILNGCCLGHPSNSWCAVRDAEGVTRWPSAQVELLFNAVAWGALMSFRRLPVLRGQLFHVYLLAYGLFRFWHEFVRETPNIVFGLSGYQIASIFLFGLGMAGFAARHGGTQRTESRNPGLRAS
jgi:phosphatidylglycerol:prolipoprotein diacylglycerol transferase